MSFPRLAMGLGTGSSRLLLVAAAIFAAASLCGCLGLHHRQAGADLLDDKVTNDRVQAALQADPTLHLAGVQAATTNGVVTLSGFVHTAREKTKAVELVRTVGRVKELKDDIQVKP